MIYLIKVALLQLGELEENDRLIFSYKIGYSEDSRILNGTYKRFADYINSGLSFRIIKTIPGGSLKLEHFIQRKFSEYRLEGRSIEWFHPAVQIKEFFDKCNTVSDIYGLFGFCSEEDFLSSFNKPKVKKFNIPPTNKILDFDRIIDTNIDTLDESTLSILSHLRDNCKHFNKALKYICEELDQEQSLFVISLLPEIVQNYYNVLGPEKLKVLMYRNDNIKEAYNREVSNQTVDIKSVILEEFSVGDRYPKAIIKDKLKKIYSDAGYNKTAKATDLQDYFNIRQCEITRSDDKTKRDSGFIILSILN